MSNTFYIDSDPDCGHDSNSGTRPLLPKRTLNAALAVAQPGDTIRLHTDRLYDFGSVGVIVKTPALHLTAYGDGDAPHLRMARKKGTLLAFDAPDCQLEGLMVSEADTCVEIRAARTQVSDLTVRKFGFGIVVKASDATIEAVKFSDGRMRSNTGAKTDAGAQAITLWKLANVLHTGTRIARCTARDVFASSLAFGVDGSMIEIFGAVEDVEIRDCVGSNLATFMEVGGPKGVDGAANGVRVVGCHVNQTNGRVLFVNASDEGFYVDWRGFAFEGCTFIADDDEASPFYMAGNHGSLADRLTVRACHIQAAAQIYNAGAGTDLSSLVHEHNVYARPDGGVGVGVPLINGDVLIHTALR
jgi:hypothetical protein